MLGNGGISHRKEKKCCETNIFVESADKRMTKIDNLKKVLYISNIQRFEHKHTHKHMRHNI